MVQRLQAAMKLADIPNVQNETIAPIVPTGSVVRPVGGSVNPVGIAGPTDVREINSLGALAPYKAAWNGLLPHTPGASYFHSYDWFATYWKHYGAEQRMRVVLVFDQDGLVGVVPLTVVRERTKLGRLRSLRYPLHGWGSFFGAIGPNTELLLGRALDHVLTTRRDWDLLDFLWVDRDGADSGEVEHALRKAGLNARSTPWLESAQIRIAGGWDEYWASRKTHLRTNVRRCERRLRDQGELSYVRYRPGGETHRDSDPRWDLYELCEGIAARSWQGVSTTGTTLSHESVRAYLREAHQAAASFGGVEVNLLFVADRPLAFAYNYQFRGYVYGLRAGFDSDPSADGAGTVLQRLMIEDSCRRGDRVIDLGPGSLEGKRPWHTHIATAWRYTHYSPQSPRAQLLRLSHSLKPRRRT
jgi:CelD/BcsL family acetyltransferase involved in cellulose biosynthesis